MLTLSYSYDLECLIEGEACFQSTSNACIVAADGCKQPSLTPLAISIPPVNVSLVIEEPPVVVCSRRLWAISSPPPEELRGAPLGLRAPPEQLFYL